MKTLHVRTVKSYPIHIGSSSLAQLPEYLAALSPTGPVIIITDSNVGPLYADKLRDYLQRQTLHAHILTVPAGEEAKSLQTLDFLISQLMDSGATRQSLIVALGGGVIGDLAGFTAATYMRGIRLVQIPTTLLAQIDSSIGGKVGINHPMGKNIIGAFYHPELVLIDPAVLPTLPQRELRAGTAEMVKYALIQDSKLFHHVDKRLGHILQLTDLDEMADLIYTSCAIKVRIVDLDEREQGIRATLNFGHTIGHALEAVTRYQYYRHGEAVTLGMAAAVFISRQMGFLQDDPAQAVWTLLKQLQPPAVPKDVTPQAVRLYLRRDKKRIASGQQWVLLNDIGSCFITTDVADSLIDEAVEFSLHFE
ncbi:3-dehydroquinate synthase [candidate division KSB1 bacterium]|nr:3-dehydroquinate synthase [candidate division KSB1 bacterium]